MPFPHEVIAAWPTPGTGDPDRELIRAMTTRRFAYALADDEVASDFVAKDPVSGVPPLNLIQFGTLYAYDETDSTTAPSDVCLVTSDACRYKSGSVKLPDSVLTYSTTAQPADVDVSDGDTFLLPIGATGADWAGKAGQIAIRKGARWYFAISPIGRGLYVEDEDARYYRNASGVWTAGSGSVTLAANAVKITNVLGAKASFQIKVENQTTNAPPVSPVAPVAYIIGPSPTGAWAAHAGKLAYCLVDGLFTIIAPEEGDEVWDKTQNNKYVFNGTAWAVSTSVVFAQGVANTTTSLTPTYAGVTGTYFPYTQTVAPDTQGHVDDTLTATITAPNTSAKIEIYVSVDLTGMSLSADSTIGIRRDSESALCAWWPIRASNSAQFIQRKFIIAALDASSHTYKIAHYRGSASDTHGSFLTRELVWKVLV
jgi:hypothetical protein